tara:strand:+ start:421 stop:2046 length:1626 start_codon:yes stop_codon:yes gene_type:complete
MFRPFTLLLFFFLLLDFASNAQSQKTQIQELTANENNDLKAEELNHYLDSISPFLSSPPIGKYIGKALSLNQFNSSYYKNHQVNSWKIQTRNLKTRVFFKNLSLENGDSLFTYNLEGDLLEIKTIHNTYGSAFTSLASINGLVFQLKNYSKNASAQITGYSLESVKDAQFSPMSFGESEACQVNINCNEGDDFRNIQKSVVRILMKIGSSFLWCTGTVVNNTSYNYEPYILSAEHCGLLGNDIAPQSDLDSWTFYFNYESPDCDNPSSEGNLDRQRMTGANLLANSDDQGGDFGSDFLLLKLQNNIPTVFNAYYSGWNHNGLAKPKNGVGIHHPSGDIKKISSYEFPAESGSFGSTVSDTHWLVNWRPSLNGYGTTEQGSSGSPIFDENNLLRGVLTGGGSACNNLSGKDYYGKLSYSWNSNGNLNTRRLDKWLDPTNTGYLAINGAFEGDSKPILDGEEIEIFPNPANENIVKIRNIGRPQESLTLSVFSFQGQLLFSSEVVSIPGKDYELEITKWPNGIYYIQIEQNSDISRQLLIIRK